MEFNADKVKQLKSIGSTVRSFVEDTGATALIDIKSRPGSPEEPCLVVMMLCPTDVAEPDEIEQSYRDTEDYIETDLHTEAQIVTSVEPRIKTINGGNFAVAGFVIAVYDEDTKEGMRAVQGVDSGIDDNYGDEIEDSLKQPASYSQGKLLFD